MGLLSLPPLPSPTDSMSILLRHQTRSAFVQNYVRLLRRCIHSSIATKDSNTIIKHVPFLNRSLVSRSFYSSPVDHSNCDFGSPCACSECMQDRRKPICEICRVRPTVHQSCGYSYDRKGLGGYDFTSFCEQCWQKRETARREKEEKEKQILASYKARVASMLDNVQQIRLTEQVPIVCAVDKFMTEVRPVHDYTPSGRITARMMDEMRKIRSTEQVSYWNALEKYRSEVGDVRSVQSLNRFRGKFQRRIIDGLSKELQIVKIRNKYMCNKLRVDAMDFKLWFFADRPYYET